MSINNKVKKYFHLYDGDRIRSIIFYESEEIMLSIPQDLSNSDYQKYLEWVEDGNIPEEWKPE